ncbi:hypothetical protein V6N13_136897 [Hibiscus sabdariffa]|uniref:Uncharacterized protein n=1 Tax=Hibiscus sabdariffa TaxID=183260 RepID=A0ABR2DM84_9ROSI
MEKECEANKSKAVKDGHQDVLAPSPKLGAILGLMDLSHDSYGHRTASESEDPNKELLEGEDKQGADGDGGNENLESNYQLPEVPIDRYAWSRPYQKKRTAVTYVEIEGDADQDSHKDENVAEETNIPEDSKGEEDYTTYEVRVYYRNMHRLKKDGDILEASACSDKSQTLVCYQEEKVA